MASSSIEQTLDNIAILKTLKQYELIDTSDPKFNIKPIVRESINKNFKVTDGHQTILLKIFSQGNTLPIDRNKVFKMQEELAILGIAPTPLFLNKDKTIYCEQWIEFSKHKEKDLVKLLAESLYNTHNSFVSAPLLALDEHWQLYWQKIDDPSELLKQQYESAMIQWEYYLLNFRDQFVLCHNDLHTEHLSYTNGPLFDWEYAGMGCRYFDIASCCLINKFKPEQTSELFKIYAELSNQDFDDLVQKVKNASNLVDFTYELWNKSLGNPS